MNTLALTLVDRGEYDGAAEIWQQRLDIQRRTLGDENRRTLESMNRLAWFLKDHGPDMLAEAEALAQEATNLCREVLAGDDQLTFGTADTLAVVSSPAAPASYSERSYLSPILKRRSASPKANSGTSPSNVEGIR